MAARGEWNVTFDRWIEGFDDLGARLARSPRMRTEWKLAGDLLFSRSQQYVHVLSGDLKATGQPAEVTVEAEGLTFTVTYGEAVNGVADGAPYAIYEFAHGGSHDALGRAFRDVRSQLEQAIVRGYEQEIEGWK